MKLEQRLHELREDERRHAPSFEGVLRHHEARRAPPWPWLWLGAATLACVIAATLRWMPSPPEPAIMVEGPVFFGDDLWTTPSDALLAENAASDLPPGDAVIDTLTNDINQLLKP